MAFLISILPKCARSEVVLTAHWYLIYIPSEGIGNVKGAISPFKLLPTVLDAISLIFSSHAMETLAALNHLKFQCTAHVSPVVCH